MLNIPPPFGAGAIDLMALSVVMSGLAVVIVIASSWLFVARFSIAGTSLATDAGLAVVAFLLGKVWMACLPRMLAVYNCGGGGAASAIAAWIIIREGAAGPICVPAFTGAVMGSVAMSGSAIALTKFNRPDAAQMPVLMSTYNALAGFAIALEGIAIGNTALAIAGLLVGAGRTLMTLPLATVPSPALSIGVAGKRVPF